MAIKRFDRTGAEEFAEDLKSLLAVLEDHCDVKIETGKIKYDPDSGKLITTIEACCKTDDDGKAVGPRELEYLAWAIRQPPGQVLDLGEIFICKDTEFKITGYNRKARKYPLIAVNTANGKNYKFPISYAIIDKNK